jgi:hypothetical protein
MSSKSVLCLWKRYHAAIATSADAAPKTYRSMNAKVAQCKNFPLGVNITIELENITTSDKSGTILVESYPASCHYYKMRLYF